MSILTLGVKSRLINNAADVKTAITGAGQAAVLFIAGFGTFPISEVVADSIRAARPVAGVKSKHTIEVADITLANLPAAGTTKQVYVSVALTSDNTEIEFENAHPDTFGKGHRFPISVVNGETAETFLRKVLAQIEKEALEDQFDLITATPTYTTPGDSGTPLTQLVIEVREAGLNIHKVEFIDGEHRASSIVTAYDPAITAGYEGAGQYKQVDREFPQTEGTTYPYAVAYAGQERPVKGSTYSLIRWKSSHSRNDVSSPESVDTYGTTTQTYELYINDTQTALRDQVLDFLLTKTGVVATLYGTNGAVAASAAAWKA